MRELAVYVGELASKATKKNVATYNVNHRIEVYPLKEILDIFDNEMHTCECECHGKLPRLYMRPFGAVEYHGIIEDVAGLRSKLAVMGPKESLVIPLVKLIDLTTQNCSKYNALFLYWM